MTLKEAIITLSQHKQWLDLTGEDIVPHKIERRKVCIAIDTICTFIPSLIDGKDICRAALGTFGTTAQIDEAVEECAELSDALMKFKYGRCARRDVITEIADVKIVCEQMAILMSEKEVQKEVDYKLSRLKGRIAEHDGTV